MIKTLTRLDSRTDEKTNETFPIRISYRVLKKVKNITGKGLSKIDDEDYPAYEALLWCAIEEGHKVEGVPNPYSKDQMEEVLDSVFNEFIKIIPLFFPKTEEGGESKKEESPEKKEK